MLQQRKNLAWPGHSQPSARRDWTAVFQLGPRLCLQRNCLPNNRDHQRHQRYSCTANLSNCNNLWLAVKQADFFCRERMRSSCGFREQFARNFRFHQASDARCCLNLYQLGSGLQERAAKHRYGSGMWLLAKNISSHAVRWPVAACAGYQTAASYFSKAAAQAQNCLNLHVLTGKTDSGCGPSVQAQCDQARPWGAYRSSRGRILETCTAWCNPCVSFPGRHSLCVAGNQRGPGASTIGSVPSSFFLTICSPLCPVLQLALPWSLNLLGPAFSPWVSDWSLALWASLPCTCWRSDGSLLCTARYHYRDWVSRTYVIERNLDSSRLKQCILDVYQGLEITFHQIEFPYCLRSHNGGAGSWRTVTVWWLLSKWYALPDDVHQNARSIRPTSLGCSIWSRCRLCSWNTVTVGWLLFQWYALSDDKCIRILFNQANFLRMQHMIMLPYV